MSTEYKDELEDIDAAILEFRGGVGGDEAFIFAQEMSDHYKRFLETRGFRVSEIKDSDIVNSKSVKLKA